MQRPAGYQVPCSNSLRHIPLRQGLALNLLLGWKPINPIGLPVCISSQQRNYNCGARTALLFVLLFVFLTWVLASELWPLIRTHRAWTMSTASKDFFLNQYPTYLGGNGIPKVAIKGMVETRVQPLQMKITYSIDSCGKVTEEKCNNQQICKNM